MPGKLEEFALKLKDILVLAWIFKWIYKIIEKPSSGYTFVHHFIGIWSFDGFRFEFK